MANELQTVIDPEIIARVLMHGDLSLLTESQKVAYYLKVCETLGLNPYTRPFQYMVLNGTEQLYAKREATEQLRKLHHVSLTITAREVVEDMYIVTARATTPEGRTDESIGARSIASLKGEARANAVMTAETKSKRRVTLSICGLGMLDETEVADIPAQVIDRPALQIPPPAPIPHPPPPDPDPPIPPPPAAEWVRVLEVREGPTRNPKVLRYSVLLSNGREATTIKTRLAAVAKNCRETETPVRATIEESKFGSELVALTPREPADIPF